MTERSSPPTISHPHILTIFITKQRKIQIKIDIHDPPQSLPNRKQTGFALNWQDKMKVQYCITAIEAGKTKQEAK